MPTFDWRDYLEIARHLQGQAGQNIPDEAAYRCCVSRSYYSAFCFTRNFASRPPMGYVIRGDYTDHKELRDFFRNHYQRHPKFKNIHQKLERLHNWRKMCDYDDVIENPFSMATHAINLSEQIFEKLQ